MNAASTIYPRSGARARAIASAVGLALAMLAALSPSPASAGSYKVTECHPNDGIASAPDAVPFTNSTGYVPSANCGSQDHGLYIDQPINISVDSLASWAFFAPPGTSFRTVAFQYRFNPPSNGSSSVSLLPPGGFWTGESFGWQTASVQAGAFESLTLASQCTPNGGFCSADVNPAAIKNLEFDIVDASEPSAVATAGSLTDAGTHQGTESLVVRGHDTGGGVYDVSVKVNGLEIDRQTSNCSFVLGRAASFRPCPANTSRSFELNTEGIAWRDGQNTLETCAQDLSTAGPANVGCTERVVEIDNSCTKSDGSPQASSLSADLKPPKRQPAPQATVKSTEGVPLQGSLVGPGGPIGGANVCVYERVDAPADARQLLLNAKTKGDGSFGMQIPPGPSRTVDVVYRFNNQVLRKQVYVASQAVPSLTIKKRKIHNGQNMRFKGTIPRPHAEDRAVTMQAKIGKRSWRTFKQLKTESNGQFKGRYKFKNSTLPRAKYTFRVLVKKQSGYPYEPGASRKRKVIVFG